MFASCPWGGLETLDTTGVRVYSNLAIQNEKKHGPNASFNNILLQTWYYFDYSILHGWQCAYNIFNNYKKVVLQRFYS